MTVERATYLGMPLEVTDRGVTVLDRKGRRLASFTTFHAARIFIRGYRRVPSNVEHTPRGT